MAHRLPNYLRMYRKRAGLGQAEVAYLLGVTSGSKVSRYERGTRLPNLETAFSLEVIFQAPLRDLFAGRYETVKRITEHRARLLAQRLLENPKRKRPRS